MDTLTFFTADIPLPKMETEDYLQQSMDELPAILSNPKTQLPFLTYGYTTTNAIEFIVKLLKRSIPCAPPVIPTPNPDPIHERTIPVPGQSPMNVPTIGPTVTHVPFQVQRVPTVNRTIPSVQVHKVPLKYPGAAAIPSRKALPLQPVCPILKTWRHDPRLRHTRAAAVAQLVIQEHLNHLYHPVTGQQGTYDKLNI